MLKIRMAPEETAEVAFGKLKRQVKDLQKDHKTYRLKEVRVKDGELILPDDGVFPMTAKAESELYGNLGLQKLNDLVKLVPIEDGREDIKDRVIAGAFKTLEGKALRFHLVTSLKGEREIQSVQSARFDAVNELEILEAAEAATKEFNMVPFNFSYDEDRSFLQLIRLDQRIKLPKMVNPLNDHRIIEAEDDIVHGLITLKISPTEANTVEAGWFQRFCTNSSIFDAETELSIRATRTQGLSLEYVLPGLMKAIVEKQDTTSAKLIKMQEQPFNDISFIEQMFENNTLKRVYGTYIEHQLEEVRAVNGTRADAWNRITRSAHTVDVEPFKQIQMEKIGGKYILATDLAAPSRN